jgi:hypothetical protein
MSAEYMVNDKKSAIIFALLRLLRLPLQRIQLLIILYYLQVSG